MATTGWLKGKVKAVPSGDSLVIMGNTKAEIPPEKTITLSSLVAPRLVYLFITPESSNLSVALFLVSYSNYVLGILGLCSVTKMYSIAA